MKVLHVINSMCIGGAEMLLANSLSTGALPEVCENVLVYLQGDSEILSKIDKRVKVICLEYKGVTTLNVLIRKLRSVIKNNNIDIIHSHLNPAGFYTRIAAPAKYKQVHTLHIMYTRDTETGVLKKKLEDLFLLKSRNTSLIFLSELLRKDFLSHIKFKNKTFVLNNFISDDFFKPYHRTISEDKFKIIAVGNIRVQKNYKYLVEVFKYLKEYDIALDIYGSGDNKWLQSIIDGEGLNIKLMGQTTDTSTVLGEYDLFIMASTFEGYPLSVIEAMATGLPCLLSNIPALKDIGKDYAEYFELNDPYAAAQKIIAISENREVIFEKGRLAKEYAANIGKKENYVKNLIRIYQSL